jgi:predicted nuclease with TOPRIM domain
MEHSQYRDFLSCDREGTKALVIPAGDHDHIGCFTDQVKLTHALVRDLDEVVKEVKLLGQHEEESSQKITKLEAMCKRLREDTQKLKEEKTTLKGMIRSLDELVMEMPKSMDSTTWERTTTMRMWLTMMKGVPSHPVHLRLLLCLRRSLKKKPPWRWFPSKRPLWRMS